MPQYHKFLSTSKHDQQVSTPVLSSNSVVTRERGGGLKEGSKKERNPRKTADVVGRHDGLPALADRRSVMPSRFGVIHALLVDFLELPGFYCPSAVWTFIEGRESLRLRLFLFH